MSKPLPHELWCPLFYQIRMSLCQIFADFRVPGEAVQNLCSLQWPVLFKFKSILQWNKSAQMRHRMKYPKVGCLLIYLSLEQSNFGWWNQRKVESERGSNEFCKKWMDHQRTKATLPLLCVALSQAMSAMQEDTQQLLGNTHTSIEMYRVCCHWGNGTCEVNSNPTMESWSIHKTPANFRTLILTRPLNSAVEIFFGFCEIHVLEHLTTSRIKLSLQ